MPATVMDDAGNTEAVAEQRRRQASWRPWSAMLDHLEKLHEARGRVFDLGCGTGEVSQLFLERGWAEVVGVDSAPQMIQPARVAYPEVRFVERDLRDLAGAGLEPADLIWSSYTVQYFGKHGFEALFGEWSKCIKPGGLLAVCEIDGLFSCHVPQANGGDTAFEEMECQLRDQFGYDCFAARTIADAMRGCGLSVIADTAWEDAEFSFDGAAVEEIVHAWAQRFERMKFPGEYFNETELMERKVAFLECIASPEHRTVSKVRLVIGQKVAETQGN